MSKPRPEPAPPSRSVVVIGSYREDLAGLLAFTQYLDARGIRVLHPPPLARALGEDDGFVRLNCDRSLDPGLVQRHVFAMIEEADAVVVYCPAGRIGVSAAMEIGYCLRAGKRILATAPPEDGTLRALIGYDPSALTNFLGTAAPQDDTGAHAQAPSQ